MRHTRSDGFALLEALVALAIFGVMTGMFMQVVSSNAATRHHVVALRSALLVAQSQLTLALETGKEGARGRDGDLVWRSEISRYPGSNNGRGLEQVTVVVAYPATDSEIVRLSSLRLVN